jgi:hypothetical protein
MVSAAVRCAARAALAVLVAALLAPAPARAWGEIGHRIVATIADRYLGPTATRQVRELLGQEGAATLADVATWADAVVRQQHNTLAWHSVLIPLEAAGYDAARDCPHDNCVVAQIDGFRRALADRKGDPRGRVEALKFLVHLVADVHQPMNCVDHRDGGGTAVRLRYFGRATTLHAVWDSGVIERLGAPDKLEARLAAAIRPADLAAWSTGTPASWAAEAHAIAQHVAYGTLPEKPPLEIGQAYEAAAEPMVEQQLVLAGVRLAGVLNEALEPPAREPWWRFGR